MIRRLARLGWLCDREGVAHMNAVAGASGYLGAASPVDRDLRVRGLGGLRVVNASVAGLSVAVTCQRNLCRLRLPLY
ncbi:hypothetical protein [Nonomuraea aridisoli]|uniref:hypothetical protein n=1 Tax=Nonomuraea aridisoli TaxID=2070368 RepID=UPI0011B93608|nr:hypothetical protein [Nonomuraea aridisoli]